jgi:high-affinity nickel-transport protein
MSTLLTIIALGLFLGMRHATDPDHVVAVTTIVSRERTMLHAAIVGALWGLGHTVTIFVVGSAMILLKLTISPTLGLAMELSVALMLILLGALNLTGLMNRGIEWLINRGYLPGIHAHVISGRMIFHGHDGYRGNGAVFRRLPSWCGKLGLFHIVRPLAVGVVHGLAGSAAVTLLVLATITQPGWAIAYLLVFGMGTILGMMLITAALALPYAYTWKRFAHLNQGLAIASGVISVSFGLLLCYQIVISDGLLTGHPSWTPR